MKIFICDDELEDAKSTKKIIDGYRGLTDITIVNPDEMVLDIEEGFFDCDIVILDIEYHKDNLNGIAIGHMINEKYPACQIIYLTKVTDYASDVYETEHVYFVTKMNQQRTLFRAIDKAIDRHNSDIDYRYIKVFVEKKNCTILQRDIVYLERNERVTTIFTSNDEMKTYSSLSSLSKNLSDDFARCHGSYVVNLNSVVEIENGKVVLKNGRELPIGRTYKDSIMKKYMSFLSRRI